MRSISVLNVGDGACSVLREHSSENDGLDRTAIIDCGSNPRRARSAARLLAGHLSSRDWRSLSELVVTHFDADHWEGLLRVVDHAPASSGAIPPDLRIFFPAVPFGVDRRLPAGLMAFITTTGPYGVQALDLRAAWSRLTSVRLVPLSQGDSFTLAGRLHDVVWPPRRLEEQTSQRLNKLVQRIEEEAQQLAHDGYPQLQNSLRDAYEDGLYNQHPVGEGRATNDLPDFAFPKLLSEEAGKPHVLISDNSPDSAIPQEKARSPEFKNLVRRARAAQNDLSLVFHDQLRASLLVFGDAPARVVERVRHDLRTDGYQVALAPHHGSQQLRNGAPGAEACISQAGRGLRQFWPNHTNSHLNCGDCLHTHDNGDITRNLR